MAKGAKPQALSKAQMAREERRYRAESMVKDAMTNTPEFRSAVRQAERQLAKAESSVRSSLLKKGGEK
jgi:hypothetical protein